MAARGSSGLATLVVTPILVWHLGASRFGLWTVLVGASAVATYADAGLGSMLLRETSGAHTGDAALRRAQGALGLALIVPTAIGAVLVAGVLVAWPVIESGLRLGTLTGPAQAAALILVARVVVDGWGGAARAALEGTGRIPLAAGVTAATGILIAVLSLLAVLADDGLIGLALAMFIGAAVRTAMLTALARRLEPQLTPRPRALSGRDLKAFARYGAAVQVSQAGVAFNAESDRLVVSRVVGLDLAGGLEIGLRVASLLALVPFCVLYSLFPAMARLTAEDERSRVDELYVSASRFVAGAALVPAAGLAACAPSAVLLWLGRPIPFAAACLVAFCPVVAVGSLTGVAAAICRAEGMPGREARFVTLTVGLNIGLTIVLTIIFGPIGVPAATAVATILGTAGFLARFHRATHRPISMLADALTVPILAALAAGGAASSAGLLTAVGSDRAGAARAIAVRATAGVLAASGVFGAAALSKRLRRAPARRGASADLVAPLAIRPGPRLSELFPETSRSTLPS